MKSPLVSIIIPVFNTGKNAVDLATSVLEQQSSPSAGKFQLILVDDGSTDDSLSLLKQLQKTNPDIIVLTQKNSGSPAGARNTGLQHATGRYVSFLDSDDSIDDKFFARMLSKIQKTASDLVVCGLKYHRLADGSVTDVFASPPVARLPQEDLPAYVVRLLGNDGRLYGVINKLFLRSIIDQHHLQFDQSINFGEDLLFVLGYLRHATSISFVNEPLYIYHFGTATSTVKNSSLQYANWQQNWQFLVDWFRPESQYESDHLGWVKYRWSYAYCLAVCRSDKTGRQKRRLLAVAVADPDLPKIGRAANIGRSKYLMELVYRAVRITPATLFVFASLAVRVKKVSLS